MKITKEMLEGIEFIDVKQNDLHIKQTDGINIKVNIKELHDSTQLEELGIVDDTGKITTHKMSAVAGAFIVFGVVSLIVGLLFGTCCGVIIAR